jgi:hypothetical protein
VVTFIDRGNILVCGLAGWMEMLPRSIKVTTVEVIRWVP